MFEVLKLGAKITSFWVDMAKAEAAQLQMEIKLRQANSQLARQSEFRPPTPMQRQIIDKTNPHASFLASTDLTTSEGRKIFLVQEIPHLTTESQSVAARSLELIETNLVNGSRIALDKIESEGWQNTKEFLKALVGIK